jgi:hypothetical protein
MFTKSSLSHSEISDRSSEMHLKAIFDYRAISNYLYFSKLNTETIVYTCANKSPLFLKSECKPECVTSAELHPTG